MTLIYPPFFVTDFLETLSGQFQLLDERVILELQILPLSLCIQCLHLTQSLKKKTVRYFVTKNQMGLQNFWSTQELSWQPFSVG